jgi:hypothetical protein
VHIYDAEKKAGLADLLCNKEGLGVANITGKIKSAALSTFDKMIASLKSISSNVETIEDLIGNDQPDLALVVSVLASVGWNLNDDIFTPAELWKARETAIHKPMNHMHDGNIILGHIVKSRAIDKFGQEIILGEEDNVPNDFDVEVAGVLYKFLPERIDLVEDILAKANEGKMFVSMECWFQDFAFGFIDESTGKTKIVERNESTAFLTKHLRIFNGTGEFDGNKLGRVLKDFVFGGQGFVTEPANPESVIKVAAKKVAASCGFENTGLENIPKGGLENMDTEKMAKELESVKADLEKAQTENKEMKEQLDEVQANDFETKIGALNAKVEELTTNIAEANDKIETIQKEKVELQKKLDETVNEAKNAKSELDKVNKSVKAKERLETLSKIKEIEDKDATLAELAEMSDETFDVVLKYAGEAQKSDEKVEDNKEDKEVVDEDNATAALNDVETKEEADHQPGNDAPNSDEDVAMALANTLTSRKRKGGE